VMAGTTCSARISPKRGKGLRSSKGLSVDMGDSGSPQVPVT
jgi:hypothetical protein